MIDTILDPLTADGRVEKVPFNHLLLVACPMFVVWNKGKARVVINLHQVNKKSILNAYPFPRQDEVLGAIGGAIIFSFMDITKGFF